MARTANRGANPTVSPNTIMRWRLGEYIRLSKEDAQKAKGAMTATVLSIKENCWTITTTGISMNLKARKSILNCTLV